MKRFFILALTCCCGFFLGRWIQEAVFQANPSTEMSGLYVAQPEASRSLLGERQSSLAPWESRLGEMSENQRLLWLGHLGETSQSKDMKRLMELAPLGLEQALAERWARIDPKAFLESLQLAFTEANVTLLFDHWMAVDPHTALDLVSQDRFHRWKHFLVRSAFKHDPEFGFKAMRHLEVIGVTNVPTEAIPAWAAKDPKHAAGVVAAPPYFHRTSDTSMKLVGEVWAKQDPKAALAFARTLNPLMGTTLTESTMQAWVARDPEAAVAYLNASNDPFEQESLAKGLLVGLTDKDPRAALALAQESLQSQARAEATAAIVQHVSKEDRARAAELLRTLSPGTTSLSTAAMSLARSWETKSVQDRDEALAWIDLLPDGAAQRTAMEAFQRKLQGLGNFGLADFVAGPYGHLAYDELIKQAAEQRARHDYESALAWAKALPTSRRRVAIESVRESQ